MYKMQVVFSVSGIFSNYFNHTETYITKQHIYMEKSLGFWIAIGVAIGVGLGTALDNYGLGIGMGIAIGVAIGVGQSQSKKKDE